MAPAEKYDDNTVITNPTGNQPAADAMINSQAPTVYEVSHVVDYDGAESSLRYSIPQYGCEAEHDALELTNYLLND